MRHVRRSWRVKKRRCSEISSLGLSSEACSWLLSTKRRATRKDYFFISEMDLASPSRLKTYSASTLNNWVAD
jgi:hypothetical protein